MLPQDVGRKFFKYLFVGRHFGIGMEMNLHESRQFIVFIHQFLHFIFPKVPASTFVCLLQ